MQYTLITKNGKVMQFYLKQVADLYNQLYGSVIVTEEVFNVENNTKISIP